MKGLRRRFEQFRRAGARIVTISTDSVEDLEKYRKKSSAPFTMLSDSERDTIREYDIYNASERGGIAIPAIFIVDSSGVTRYSNVQGKYIRVRNRELLREVASL